MKDIKVIVVSHDKKAKSRIEKQLIANSLSIVKKNPDFVFVYGGDGSILYSERLYPGVPIVAIKGSSTSKTRFYIEDNLERIISMIKEDNYVIEKSIKLTAEIKNRKFDALNEIQVHNKNQYESVRFRVYIDGTLKHDNIVGDGALVCTPFGSGAYYYSIGGELFGKGLGLGFNNPHERIDSSVVSEESVIAIEIIRGIAFLVRDNDSLMISMKPNDLVVIKKSRDVARFLSFPDL